MVLISHRGNINGAKPQKENRIDYIENAIQSGFDVEIDLWFVLEGLFLGHDIPQYPVELDWLQKYKDKLWIHCKNLHALNILKNKNLNYFWHEHDSVTITSKGYIWAYPGVRCSNSIAVHPEKFNGNIPSDLLGVCSDNIINYE